MEPSSSLNTVSLDLISEVTRFLQLHYNEHRVDKEFGFFFCNSHAYIEVSVLSDLSKTEQQNFVTDGRLGKTYLRDM